MDSVVEIVKIISSGCNRIESLVLSSVDHSSTLDTLLRPLLKLEISFNKCSWSKKSCLARLYWKIDANVVIAGTKVMDVLYTGHEIALLRLIDKNEQGVCSSVILINLEVVITRFI